MTDDPFVRISSETSYTTRTIPPGQVGEVSFPTSIASDTPDGREVTIVVTVTTNTGETVEDTLRVPIAGQDTRPPSVSYYWRSNPLKTPVGSPFTTIIYVEEPGPLESVTAYVVDSDGVAILDSLSLFRRAVDSDEQNTSLQQMSREFTVSWTPPREMSFRLLAVAVDRVGNLGKSPLTPPVTAWLFHRTADLLLYGHQYWVSRYERILNAAGILHDMWTSLDQGPIPSTVLDLYRGRSPGIVVWQDRSMAEEGLWMLNGFLSAGGRLLTMGRVGGSRDVPLALQVFFRDFVKAEPTGSTARWTQIRG